ncbi:MAG: endo-1,4-beta-xylanase [Muribaculaceae bacterium]|nr:endo-1,4-beta-xylanase [Muribaculaceae bacterium]
MKKTVSLLFAAAAALGAAASGEATMKDAFGDMFRVGVAINDAQAKETDTRGAEVVKRHFNTVVPENVMKSEKIHPERDVYFWDDADAFVKFGEDNGLTVIGHCLIWHSQLAPWFPYDDNGQYVSADTLKARMRDHIHTVVGRYKGRIKGWDVVNEAIVESGAYRKSPFYEILGEEFIPLAFQYAHEADPDAELYYNDYGMNVPGRRDAVVRMVRELKNRGLRIDAIGMQGHMGMDYPDFRQFEQAIEAFASTGCKVMITEWDMSALPTLTRSANVADVVAFQKALNPYPDNLPDDVAAIWNSRMDAFMSMFVRHADVIDRVTVWGVSDGDSWKNGWPMRGRKEYPLLFDRNYEMKPFMKKLIQYHSVK